MYVLIGKEKCNQCNILKNLLDEKGIQYHYLDVSKIPHELLTYLRMYCNTYPIVLGVKYFFFSRILYKSIFFLGQKTLSAN